VRFAIQLEPLAVPFLFLRRVRERLAHLPSVAGTEDPYQRKGWDLAAGRTGTVWRRKSNHQPAMQFPFVPFLTAH